MKKFTCLLMTLFWGGLFSVFSQTVPVQGTVTDENNLPLLGVNVLVKNKSTGTTTDFDGNYSVDVEINDTLVFSYIGFNNKEFVINEAQTLDVTLEENQSDLEEVVVVGYGTQKKSVVTGAISSVNASDLETLPINTVGEALQGRTSGLTVAASSGQPGSGATIRVRGITTLNNNDPLWIVDGVVVDNGGINYLNQSDIASIEVLKDAASQAIYGARAASGVILVTTKSGKEGRMKLSYNTYAGFSEPADRINLTNATEYAALRNEASINDGGDIVFSDLSSFGTGTDWQDVIFNDSAFRQNHELSLSGGSDVSSFYFSFGYLEEEGIVATDISNYERTNIRLNSTHNITPWLTFGENFGYSRNKSVGIGNTNSEYGGPLSSAINLDPLTPVIVTDPERLGQFPYNQDLPFIRDANGNPYGISQNVAQEIINPLAYIQTRLGNFGYSDNFVGNAFVEAEPVEGLVFRSNLGVKLSYWGDESFTPINYLNASTSTAQTSFTRSSNNKLDYNLENTISYSDQIGEHDFTILLGQGAYKENEAKGLSVTKYGIPVDNFDDASLNFDVPEDDIVANGYENVPHKVASLFGRINYNYGEKYLFSGIIRRDGSSRFGANNKYGIFPSASVGWVASRENFWGTNNPVSFFKLRGSYGVVGNDNVGDLAFLSTIGSGRNYAFGDQLGSYDVGYSPDAPANPDLKWEETSQLNIGFESRFLDGFSLEVDWYRKETTDILLYPRIPAFAGVIGNPARNVGDMENTGVEMNLGYSLSGEDFGFSANANASYLHNEVTFLGDGQEYLDGGEAFQSSTFPITRTAVGEAVNSFYGFKTLGIFQTQEEINNYTNAEGQLIQPNAVPGDFRWQDTDGNGSINEEDRVFIGDPTPNWSYGITINGYYKNFDFTVFGQGVAGNQIFQGLRRLDIANANYPAKALDRWTGPGTSDSFPRMTNDDPNNNYSNPSDFYLEDGDYFRIKTAQIGYSLPESVLSTVGFEKVRVYVMSENLFTFTKYSGFDPEIGGGVLSIDRGIYPQARSFMLGASIGF
ncbi:TonB-dependent receptor [Zunongwangia sp. F363]|uniref:TonB-dependent receptor n=1 Tax=Autumnicola tepida TaxID=3075595 RepID=A0ABU3C7B1_9FLAO|nr:TonB-dependent receptor [Zunongwangia sp. F363]MDT0642234.1 TonB-dependent receptor [Zunongwangia sp. F363]